MNYHGNYCGPYWSAGKVQPSVLSDVPAVDEFDATCLDHDAVYATGGDLTAADWRFFKENSFCGCKRSIAAAAVGAQAIIRSIDKYIPKIYQDTEKMTKVINTKTNKMVPRLREGTKKSGQKERQVQVTAVPASYGYSIRSTSPIVTRRANGATIKGSDFAGSVQSVNAQTYEPACSVFINPSYFTNSTLGSLSRTYEKFRLVSATVHYVPSVPTSTQGQVVMCSTSTVKEPFISGSLSGFLGRALSQSNSVVTPIWKETSIQVAGSADWFNVNALIDGDLDDAISHEIQVYTICDSTVTCGILMIDYVIEFKEALFVYHPTIIPVPNSNGIGTTFVDNSAVNAIGDGATMDSFVVLGGGVGSVYRCVFQQAKSILPAPNVAWSTVFQIADLRANSLAVTSTITENITMNTGTVFYAVAVSGSAATFYSSYDGAIGGTAKDLIVYRTATTAVGNYAILMQMVRLGNVLRVTNQ